MVHPAHNGICTISTGEFTGFLNHQQVAWSVGMYETGEEVSINAT